jgi:hypothetical protein
MLLIGARVMCKSKVGMPIAVVNPNVLSGAIFRLRHATLDSVACFDKDTGKRKLHTLGHWASSRQTARKGNHVIYLQRINDCP